MEKKWRIIFGNGYYGCYLKVEFTGTYEEAEAWATEKLRNYAESMSYAVFGWDEEYDEAEFEDYYANCDFVIDEWSEEE